MAQASKAGKAKADPPALQFDHRLLGPAAEPEVEEVDAEENEEDDAEAAEDERFDPPFAERFKSVVEAIDGAGTDPALPAALFRIATQTRKIAEKPALDLAPLANGLQDLSAKAQLIANSLGPIQGLDARLAEIALAIREEASVDGAAVLTLAIGARLGLSKVAPEAIVFNVAKYPNLRAVAEDTEESFVARMMAAKDAPEAAASALVRNLTESDLRFVYAAALKAVAAVDASNAPPP